MTIGDIIETLKELDQNEEAAFHLLTHDQLHLAAEAAGIETSCEHVNRGLLIYQLMLDNHIGSDPYRMFRALDRAGKEADEEQPEKEQPVIH